MVQLYDKVAVSQRDALIDDLGDRIDQYELAARIVDAIEEEWGFVDSQRCHELWLLALPRLKSLFTKVARWLPDPANDE